MKIMLEPKNVIAVGEILQFQDDWFFEVVDTYILKPLEEFAKQKNMLFEKDCEKGYETGAWIYREEWKNYGVFVWTKSNKYWANMFVGVSWYEKPNRKNKIHKTEYRQLNCLSSEMPEEEWPYGKAYLPGDIRNWNYYTTDSIVKGEVVAHIKQKFEEILAEIEELGLRMP